MGRLLEHAWGAAAVICPFRDLAVGFHGGDLPGGSRSRWDLLCLRIQHWCSMGLRNQETPGAGFATFRDAELGFLGGEISGDSWSMTGLGFVTFRDAALGFHGVEDPPGSWSMEQWNLSHLGMQQWCSMGLRKQKAPGAGGTCHV